MVWAGSRGKTSCPSLGRFWLPEMMVSIGYAFMFECGSRKKLLTRHVSLVGVPNVSKIDLTNANSLPSSPASKSDHLASSIRHLAFPESHEPRLTHSATTQPAAHRSISGP